MKVVPGCVAIGAVFFLSSAAMAQQVNLEGYFIALSACEANKRKDSDNPGNVRLEVMRAYKMIGRNTTPGTHYQIQGAGRPGDGSAMGGDELRRFRAAGGARPRRRHSASGGRGRRAGSGAPAARQRREPACRELAAGLLCHRCRAEQGGMPDADGRPARRHAVLNSRPVAGRSRQQGHLPLLLQSRVSDRLQAELDRRRPASTSRPAFSPSCRSRCPARSRICSCTNGRSTAPATRTF